MAVFFDIETTGLNPIEDQVSIIGLKTNSETRLWRCWEGDEQTAIKGAVTEIKGTSTTIVGFNNLKFDVPFIVKRLEGFGHPSLDLWPLYSKKWFDLYQYLGDDFRSQKYWLEKAGIKDEHPELSGRDMPSLFRNKEYQKIEQHLVSDLNTSEALFRYLKQKNPEYIRFE